jgi:hypothetical protein
MSVEATSNSKPRVPASEPGLRLAARSSLDVMLSDAVLEGGGVGRFVKPRAAGRTIAGLARHPRRAASDAGRFGVELARVATGRSEARPQKGDRRFGDRAWQDNWRASETLRPQGAWPRARTRLSGRTGGRAWRKSSTGFLRIPVRRACGTLVPTLGDDYA